MRSKRHSSSRRRSLTRPVTRAGGQQRAAQPQAQLGCARPHVDAKRSACAAPQPARGARRRASSARLAAAYARRARTRCAGAHGRAGAAARRSGGGVSDAQLHPALQRHTPSAARIGAATSAFARARSCASRAPAQGCSPAVCRSGGVCSAGAVAAGAGRTARPRLLPHHPARQEEGARKGIATWHVQAAHTAGVRSRLRQCQKTFVKLRGERTVVFIMQSLSAASGSWPRPAAVFRPARSSRLVCLAVPEERWPQAACYGDAQQQ